MYECRAGGGLLTGPDVRFSLNITERGGWGSNCTLQACVAYESKPRRVPRSNVCEISECLNKYTA